MRCTNIVSFSHCGKIHIIECVSLPQKSSSLNKSVYHMIKKKKKGTKFIDHIITIRFLLFCFNHHYLLLQLTSQDNVLQVLKEYYYMFF